MSESPIYREAPAARSSGVIVAIVSIILGDLLVFPRVARGPNSGAEPECAIPFDSARAAWTPTIHFHVYRRDRCESTSGVLRREDLSKAREGVDGIGGI